MGERHANKVNIKLRPGVPDAPCNGCTERVLRCHATCDSYIAYRKYLDETKIAAKDEFNRTKDYMYVSGEWVDLADPHSVARYKRIMKARKRNKWR